jgi:hypothetical protein
MIFEELLLVASFSSGWCWSIDRCWTSDVSSATTQNSGSCALCSQAQRPCNNCSLFFEKRNSCSLINCVYSGQGGVVHPYTYTVLQRPHPILGWSNAWLVAQHWGRGSTRLSVMHGFDTLIVLICCWLIWKERMQCPRLQQRALTALPGSVQDVWCGSWLYTSRSILGRSHVLTCNLF